MAKTVNGKNRGSSTIYDKNGHFRGSSTVNDKAPPVDDLSSTFLLIYIEIKKINLQFDGYFYFFFWIVFHYQYTLYCGSMDAL